jgi:type II secretory pathway pseudopilin PulG
VLSIVVILLVIAVPAFQGMIASSEDALADASLRAAFKSGRDVAVQGGPGQDAAVVFFFEPGARTRAVVCVKATALRLPPQGNRRPEVDVFVPAPGVASVQLPRGWMVRGAATNIGGDWYAASAGGSNRYSFGATIAGTAGAPVNWVFPETAFFDQTVNDAGLNRSTFMVRFEGGTGLVKGSPTNQVLVVDPRPSSLDRDPRFAGVDPTRAPWSSDLGRWARSVAAGRVSDGSGGTILLSPDEINRVMGRDSSDMVLARPVPVVALYDESKLAAALGVRVDRRTETIYLSTDDPANDPDGPRLVQGVDPDRVNDWMNGLTGINGSPDYPEAKLFTVDRFTGALRRLAVQP